MNPIAIFWPMVAHFALVGAIYVLLGWRRRLAVTRDGAKIRQFKVRTEEPAASVTAANNLMNQFELPVLFRCRLPGLVRDQRRVVRCRSAGLGIRGAALPRLHTCDQQQSARPQPDFRSRIHDAGSDVGMVRPASGWCGLAGLKLTSKTDIRRLSNFMAMSPRTSRRVVTENGRRQPCRAGTPPPLLGAIWSRSSLDARTLVATPSFSTIRRGKTFSIPRRRSIPPAVETAWAASASFPWVWKGPR